jgi:hypothetical protein
MEHTRYLHFRGIFGPWWAAVNALWALVSSADLLVSKYGSTNVKQAWEMAWIAPKWGWRTWIVGFLLITFVFTFEYSFKRIKKHEQSMNERLVSKQAQLDEEIANRKRPEVMVYCDWSRYHEGIIEENQRPLILKNVSDTTAKDVQIHDIILSKGTARYKVVSLLDGKTEVPAICRIERDKDTVYAMWDLKVLFLHSFEKMGLSLAEQRVPILVDYCDTHGTGWQSVNELRYDPFLGIGSVHNLGIRRKV